MTSTINRRAVLGRLAGATAVAVPALAIAVMPATPDAEIIALGAEIVRRAAEAEHFQATRIDPFQEEFDRIAHGAGRVTQVSLDAAFAFSRECGREPAIIELQRFDLETDKLFERLMAIPATTQPGRAAKVRALMAHILLGDDWRGPAKKLEYDKDMARALLGEFAGLSATELEAI